MRYPVLVLLIVFFISFSAEARIGETFEQCVKRYGYPITNETGMMLKDQKTGLEIKQFSKEGVLIKVIFSGDKTVYIEYDYCTLKMETGEKSSEIIRHLMNLNGKGWKPDSTANDRDWLLEINDNEGVIASDRIEPGIAKDRWICNGGPEKGGLIAVKSSISCALIIVSPEYMDLVKKNQPTYFKERREKVMKALKDF